MQLPEHLQKFSKPALLVLADSVQACFYHIENDTIAEIKKIKMPRTRKSDNETAFVNPNHGMSRNGPEPKIEQDRLHHFIKELVQEMDKTKENIFFLVMPKEISHQVELKLTQNTNRIIRRVTGDYMKMDLLKIIELCLSTSI